MFFSKNSIAVFWSTYFVLSCNSVFAGDAPKPLAEQLQSLSTIANLSQRRDPFAKSPSPFKPPVVEQAPTPSAPTEAPINMNAPELERYPSSQYKVAAILLGDVYPRALVRSPENRVFVVRENDKLGKNKGHIKQITEGVILIREEIKSAAGAIERNDIRLELTRGEGK